MNPFPMRPDAAFRAMALAVAAWRGMKPLTNERRNANFAMEMP
jgi:hypothetical protein